MLKAKLKNKDINLLDVYKQKKEPSKYTPLLKYLAFPLIACVLIACTFGFLTYKNWELSKGIEDTRAQIQNVKDAIANDPNLEKNTQLITLQEKLSLYTQLYNNMQSYPEINQTTFDQILVAAGLSVDVTSLSYNRESQVVSLQIDAVNANDAELFVRRLKGTAEFSSVRYSGYAVNEKIIESNTPASERNANESKSESETKTEVVYTATILCTLK